MPIFVTADARALDAPAAAVAPHARCAHVLTGEWEARGGVVELLAVSCRALGSPSSGGVASTARHRVGSAQSSMKWPRSNEARQAWCLKRPAEDAVKKSRPGRASLPELSARARSK